MLYETKGLIDVKRRGISNLSQVIMEHIEPPSLLMRPRASLTIYENALISTQGEAQDFHEELRRVGRFGE